MNPLLDVRDLKTYFFMKEGTLKAVDGLNIHIYPKETVGLVGESGCGKSVAALSIMRLLPIPGRGHRNDPCKGIHCNGRY